MNRVIFILILIPLTAFGQVKKYDHPNYSIEYPENWILDESGKEGSSFLIHPKDVTNKDFVENINLLKQNLGDNKLTIEQLKPIIENQISNMLKNSKIIVSEIVKKEGFSYHNLIASGETSGKNFVTKIYTFSVNNFLYSLTLVSKEEDYEAIKIVSEKIMNSFSLKTIN